ncbi:phage tail tube protein [Fructilactobacillus vespulae]|uniref:phage tail tube protein n=1 Tax=Fructilactobacillus vespulae TaxID=1249630 RepID=UPI0039B51A38
MAFTKPGDTITSNSGRVTVTIDGNNYNLAEIEEIEAKLEGNTEEVKVLGRRMTGHKLTSLEGTGSLTMYHITSRFAEIAANFAETGAYPDISMTLTVEDPSSNTGKQVVQLMNVILNDSMLASLKSDDGILEMDTDFTFDDFKILQQFN